jgi:hypothetical protein
METSLLEFVRDNLAALKQADWERIALETRVPLGTIRRIRYGEVSNPRIGSIQPLYNYFRQQGQAPAKTKRAKAA